MEGCAFFEYFCLDFGVYCVVVVVISCGCVFFILVVVVVVVGGAFFSPVPTTPFRRSGEEL